MSARLLPLRLAFGALLVANAVNHFAGPVIAEPAGSAPLAWQLMTAVRDSHLLSVVIALQGLAGLAILAGVAVPFALCVAMPISVCAAFWAVILEHHVAMAAIALVMVAANAALMLAHLDAYRGVLQRRALAWGEGQDPGENYDGLYMLVGPRERLPTARYAVAAAIVLAALAFYAYFVPSATGRFAMYVILVPALLLMLRGAGASRRRS